MRASVCLTIEPDDVNHPNLGDRCRNEVDLGAEEGRVNVGGPRSRKLTVMGRSASSSALTAAVTSSRNLSGSGPNPKSIRALSGSMLPPVAGTPQRFQITPPMTCNMVWVRMRPCRRAQSMVPVTVAPIGGTAAATGPAPPGWSASVCQSSLPSLRTSVTNHLTSSHSIMPVSWG